MLADIHIVRQAGSHAHIQRDIHTGSQADRHTGMHTYKQHAHILTYRVTVMQSHT